MFTTFIYLFQFFPSLPFYVIHFICSESKSLVENIEGLNKKCLDGLSKRVLTVSIFTVKSVIRQLCRKSNKLLPEYFEAARCINTVQNQVSWLLCCIVSLVLRQIYENRSESVLAKASINYWECNSRQRTKRFRWLAGEFGAFHFYLQINSRLSFELQNTKYFVLNSYRFFINAFLELN